MTLNVLSREYNVHVRTIRKTHTDTSHAPYSLPVQLIQRS